MHVDYSDSAGLKLQLQGKAAEVAHNPFGAVVDLELPYARGNGAAHVELQSPRPQGLEKPPTTVHRR